MDEIAGNRACARSTATMSAGRDRDDRGRPRSGRARDALGRPLPSGTAGVPEQPQGPHPSAEDTIELAEQLLSSGRPFQAHEVFEDAWKSATGPERQLWRGLAQLAVGLTHRLRGNAIGAERLFARARLTLTPFEAEGAYGVDITALRGWAEQPTDEVPPLRIAH